MAFKDTRNAAELALAPAKPASRLLAQLGTLKLSLGVASTLPGVISKSSQLAGASRQSLGSIVQSMKDSEALSSSLSSSLSVFDTNKLALLNGSLVTQATNLTANTAGLPNPAGFMQFSFLTPGQPVPANFLSQINERKQQLTSLAGRISTSFTGSSFSGVTIQENFKRQPFPLDKDLNLPTTPRLAIGGAEALADDVIKDKRKFVVKGVSIAAGKPSFWSRFLSLADIQAIPLLNKAVNQVFKDRNNAGSWSEPVAPYAAQFPYNHVQQTEAGHLFELDDSPGAERVHLFHRSGSFLEMHPDGTVVYKNMKDGYSITMGDHHTKVSGNCHISVDGSATLYAKGDVNVQSDGEINMTAKKDFNVYAQNINLRAKVTSKIDGTNIDMRYINLPRSLMPVPMGGGFAPRINIAAILQDFPKSNILSILAAMAKNPLDPKTAQTALTFNDTAIAVPPQNPLSNPMLYVQQTNSARAYRARLFDTPEETADMEMYTAHIELEQKLHDYTGDPRAIGGVLTVLKGPNISNTTTTPVVDYLNYSDFKGTFGYANGFVLGNSAFRLQDVVDIALYPDLIIPKTPTGNNPGGNGSTSPNPSPDPHDPNPPKA